MRLVDRVDLVGIHLESSSGISMRLMREHDAPETARHADSGVRKDEG